MDKTAIEHIQQTAIDANKFRLPPALQDIAVAIPDNYEIRNPNFSTHYARVSVEK